ncbi:MAG: hypothetical protein J6W64_07810 [Bacilli bacterium]|nr:hypothetical protein [Bacilli bacterium]
MKFIATTSDKVSQIAKAQGQLIFSTDNRVLYLDTGADTRVDYNTIIVLVDEDFRQGIVSPIEGFYFVEETAILWRYNVSKGWEQLTSTPDERIYFYNSTSDFPVQGTTQALYVIPGSIYQWDSTFSTYKAVGGTLE